jgi:hypothetical protein
VPTVATVRAWQFADLATLGVTADDCDRAVQWISVDAHGRRHVSAGPAAIADLLRSSRPYWRVVGRVLATRPVLALAWPVYRWVSRHRDRMPGGTATCALPASQRSTPRPPVVESTDVGIRLE